MELLKNLCRVASPSGEEYHMYNYLNGYLTQYGYTWKQKPRSYKAGMLNDSMVWVFGKPRTAMLVHMDTVGFMVRYNHELITLGSPATIEAAKLTGYDRHGKIDATLSTRHPQYNLAYTAFRPIEPGTSLTFRHYFADDGETIQANNLDNRLGIWLALRMAEIMEDGIIVFTTGEEINQSNAGYLCTQIFLEYTVAQFLIADVSWVSTGIHMGQGAIISRADTAIPRKPFFDKIVEIAKKSQSHYQIEIENLGSTDGKTLARTGYPFNWCYVGMPVNNIHGPVEQCHKIDIFSMFYLYASLFNKL